MEEDDIALEDTKLPLPTAPASIPFSMRGFTDADAHRLAEKIGNYVRLLSCSMDLSRLDGVTIAYDYDEALAELDRGKAGLRPLTRSNDDQLIGVGMAPAVIRDGEVKVHVVVNAAYIEGLDEDGEGTELSDAFMSALYLLAHECAHVAVTTEKDRALPKLILQHQIASYEEAIFAQINEACWEEYAACRLSAAFGRGQLRSYEEGLRGVLGVARSRAAAAREAFWQHRDLNRVVAELSPPLAEPLRLASYVLGHLDGRAEPGEVSEETRHAIAEAGYADHVGALSDALRNLWDTRVERTQLRDFDVIGDVGREAFWDGGLLIRPADGDGATINVWEPGEVDPGAMGWTRSWREDVA